MAEFAAAKYSCITVRERYVGPKCFRKMTASGVHRRNHAHDPTSMAANHRPKREELVACGTHTTVLFISLLSHCVVPLLILSPQNLQSCHSFLNFVLHRSF
ncbi:hypothetical protein PanWU01x14_171520 [Parasponia andersonii]|uniref:Uncharacterized protein n=1 Tax=Parasponia andersonii TaxID=3476 RepID=A0A2P5C9N6_PARAD|nr:hypothetical protein PanWU01x14_171520 [Parasponia andersonii]